MSVLPHRYIELYTKGCLSGRCEYTEWVNHPTPSGFDRPYLVSHSTKTLLLDRILAAIHPGTIYYLDGVQHTKDDSPVVPYTESN